MEKVEPETKAWRITDKNVDLLTLISGLPKATIKANIGWVLISDADEWYAFFVVPFSVFNRRYPQVELTTTKLDE